MMKPGTDDVIKLVISILFISLITVSGSRSVPLFDFTTKFQSKNVSHV